jgi:hypothetical protein
MTVGEFFDAIEAYGVKADEQISGIRITSMQHKLLIRRTPLGVQIVSEGPIYPAFDTDEEKMRATPS